MLVSLHRSGSVSKHKCKHPVTLDLDWNCTAHSALVRVVINPSFSMGYVTTPCITFTYLGLVLNAKCITHINPRLGNSTILYDQVVIQIIQR